MPTIYRNVIKTVPTVLLAVYFTLLLQEHLQLPALVQILAGITFALIGFVIIKYTITKLNNNIADKRLLLLSMGIAGLLIGVASIYINPAAQPGVIPKILITALGEKNDSARQSEVWITSIKNGDQELDLKKVPLSGGWIFNNNALVSYSGQPNRLELIIEDPGLLKFSFMRQPSSGKVMIEEDSLEKSVIIDLYSKEAHSSYLYVSNAGSCKPKKSALAKTAITAISFLALSICWYLLLLWARFLNNYFLLAAPLSIFIFYLTDRIPGSFLQRLLPFALSVGCYFIMKGAKAKAFISSYSKKDKVIILSIIIFGTFAFTGYGLFLAVFPVSNIVNKVAFFILFGSWLACMTIAFLYATELCKQAINNFNNYNKGTFGSPVKLYFTFVAIILGCWLVYLIAFFPAIMSADSMVQWQQAIGQSELNNWHPVFHTLFNKLFITIYKSPVSIALAQMLFMSGIAANFFLFLYKKGIPAKWLMICALVFALIPANSIYSITLWKDVPFTFSLLWLTLVLVKIVTGDTYFSNKWMYAEVTGALVATALFRHNGMPVYALSVAGLVVYFFKTKKTALLICTAISAGLIFLYNIYISNPSRVTPNPPSVKLVAPVHGIAAVRYYGGELSPETKQEMEKIMADSVWVNYYNPFSADEYIYFSKVPFIDNLAKVPTSKVVSLYANAFLRNPFLITRDRLCGAELVWNVFPADGAYNYKYHTQVDENNFGLASSDNLLKSILIFCLKGSERVADPFLWRSGVYNILVLLLLFLFLKHRKWYSFIFIPVLGSNLGLLFSMTIQNFRYVYFVPTIFGFLWLLYISNFKSVNQS